jgi:hypothetical protein
LTLQRPRVPRRGAPDAALLPARPRRSQSPRGVSRGPPRRLARAAGSTTRSSCATMACSSVTQKPTILPSRKSGSPRPRSMLAGKRPWPDCSKLRVLPTRPGRSFRRRSTSKINFARWLRRLQNLSAECAHRTNNVSKDRELTRHLRPSKAAAVPVSVIRTLTHPPLTAA